MSVYDEQKRYGVNEVDCVFIGKCYHERCSSVTDACWATLRCSFSYTVRFVAEDLQ